MENWPLKARGRRLRCRMEGRATNVDVAMMRLGVVSAAVAIMRASVADKAKTRAVSSFAGLPRVLSFSPKERLPLDFGALKGKVEARIYTMRIGIIGAGHIGGTLGRHFVKAGHQIGLSNSRGPGSLAGLVGSLGPNACAMTTPEAAKFGELIVLAAPWREPAALPASNLVAGKIVVDAMNPYSADGEVIDLGNDTSSEVVARRLPGARLVKAFNTMYYHTLATETRLDPDTRLVLFVAGDEAAAKAVVSRLIEQIGFAAMDTGSLREGGRRQQPGSPIYNSPMNLQQARAALEALS